MSVDLRICEQGDILISKHGEVLTYVEPLPDSDFYDHKVKYSDGSFGTRIHDGHVYRNKRLPEDHDIVAIISKEDWSVPKKRRKNK